MVKGVKSERIMWDLLSISSPATNKPKKKKAWSRIAAGLRGNTDRYNATHHHSSARNCDPAHGLPDLEGEGQTIDCSDHPQMTGIRELDGRSQDTLETSQRVGEGEQGIQQGS